MPDRRSVIGGLGVLGATVVGGASAAVVSDDSGEEHDHGSSGVADSSVAYVRNVEEVRGHLASSAALLARDRRADAALHADHGSDYFAAVLPPVRNRDPALAGRLRGRLRAVSDRVETADADEFSSFIEDEIFPLLDEAVAAVVPAAERSDVGFNARVMSALAGRIATEYSAAVTADGEIELPGEYWDGYGFLGRVERRFERTNAELGDTAARSLTALRTAIEAVATPSEVIASALRFRTGVAAAVELPSASVDGVGESVEYVRSAAEVRGHAAAAVRLSELEDTAAASLHAGHGADYVLALAPAVHAVDPALAGELQDRLLALDERVSDGDVGFVTSELAPVIDEAVATVVSDELVGDASFSARVVIALLGRIEDEYVAAVTDEEIIELYGEYWDARGFYTRVVERYEAMRDALDEETRRLIEPELERLGNELRTVVPPADVANSIAPLRDDFGRAVEE